MRTAHALALVVMCGCGPVGKFEMGISSPIAVGAVVFARPSSSTTARFGLTQTARFDRDVTIVSSSIEPADAWEKLECAGCRSVEYRALRENSGTITVTADDGYGAQTFVKPIEAVMPTAVKLFVQPCEQLTYQAGVEFQLYLQLLQGSRVLADNKLALGSFAVTGGATITGVPSALWVNTANATGVGRLTSSLDPGFAVPFTVFTPAEISAIDLVPISPLVTTVTAGRTTVFTVLVRHPGAPACKDKLVRKVGTLTPAVCETLDPAATPSNDGGYFLTLRTKVPGTCTLTASVEGTQVSVTRDIQVVAAVDAGAPVDAGQKDGG